VLRYLYALCVRLTATQLYIGEACWAFLFGVIIGACTIVGDSSIIEYIENRPIWRKYI